jgi:hypothetical protein
LQACFITLATLISLVIADVEEYILLRHRRGIHGYETQEEGGGGHEFEPITKHEVVSHFSIPTVKAVKVSVPHPIPVAVPQPVPVPVPQPYPVHVRVPERVEVPIVKTVHVPVEKPYPVTVEKPVPYPVEKPYHVTIEKHVPVPVPKPFPVHYTVYKHIYHAPKKHH